MKNPEKILCLPLYIEESHLVKSTKIGSFLAPIKTRLDLDNVFDGRSSCLIDFFSSLRCGGHAKPTHVVYAVKKGVISSGDGWMCEYHKKVKCVALIENEVDETADESFKPITNKTKERRPFGHSRNYGIRNMAVQKEEADFMLDMEESEFEERNVSDWDFQSESEEEPVRNESEDEKNLDRLFRLKHDDRNDYSTYVGKVINTRRYYLFISPTRNNVQILWKRSEKRKHIARYKEAIQKTKAIVGCRAFHSSRTTKVSHLAMWQTQCFA